MNIAHDITGLPLESADTLIIWAHGWGQNRKAFAPLAEAFQNRAANILIDFPGFGDSPLPPEPWGSAQYAAAMAEFIEPYRHIKNIIWVGHSFGGRVGIELAARRADLVNGLFLVASAGLRRRRGLIQRISTSLRIAFFKTLQHLAPFMGISLDDLRKKFGSPDYRNAGALRPVLLKVVGENLTEQAKLIRCPTFLVYGSDDNETPPEIGERLAALIPDAQLSILPGQDHYSVLGAGRHLVLKRLSDFICLRINPDL